MATERERLVNLRAYLGPDGGYVPGPGNADLYEFFCQRYQELLRLGGLPGVVLPPQRLLSPRDLLDFRAWLLEEAVPHGVDFLLNTGRWAFDSEPRYTVALVAAERRQPKKDDVLEVAGVASSASEFIAQVERPGLRLVRAALGPELEIPLLQNQVAADLLRKLRSGVPFARGCGRWRCFPVQGDFNETSDRRLWQDAANIKASRLDLAIRLRATSAKYRIARSDLQPGITALSTATSKTSSAISSASYQTRSARPTSRSGPGNS